MPFLWKAMHANSMMERPWKVCLARNP